MFKNAGMDGVDKEKVQKVVYEMSKGSKYFEHEQRKEAVILQRSQHMQAQAALLTEEELANYEKVVTKCFGIVIKEVLLVLFQTPAEFGIWTSLLVYIACTLRTHTFET
jgi:hypothetical protein